MKTYKNSMTVEHSFEDIYLPGSFNNKHSERQPVVKDQAYFDKMNQLVKQKKQKQQQGGQQFFTDFIEDDPLQIDLKIDGLRTIRHIPIEIVGVYGYQQELREQPGKTLNVIVNINS